jgi:pimeloyl-ACP methyl ester carboxylesterase
MRPRRLLIAVLALAAAVIVLKPLLESIEAKLVFLPFRGEDATPGSIGIPFDEVTVTTADGERLRAWQLEPPQPIADVVYFHGNGGNLSVWLPAFAALHQMHLRVLAIDYRGYGLSTGSPTEQGVYRDAEAVARHAAARRAADIRRPVVYWGRSLGGPIAARAAQTVPPDGLVLESSFPDKASVIRRQPLLRALNTFSPYRFSTLDHLRGFGGPILVMHGDRDSVIPFELGQELFDGLAGPKRFAVIRGGDHNDWFGPDNEAYWGPVLAFIGGLR